MAKLYYYYGSMNSSKTAQLIMVAFNYNEKNQNVIVLKPSIDNREGDGSFIKSRAGLIKEEIVLFDRDTNLIEKVSDHFEKVDCNCILVDECQFLTKEQVFDLSDLVDLYNIPVMCYGLRTNFKGELFEGSKWLMAFADTISEIKTVCWCGKKATFNAKVSADGQVIRDGKEIQIGGNDTYISLCRKHWKKGIIEG